MGAVEFPQDFSLCCAVDSDVCDIHIDEMGCVMMETTEDIERQSDFSQR